MVEGHLQPSCRIQVEKKAKWYSIKVQTGIDLHEINQGSEEEFITEHYWGYTKINSNKTCEYGVEHPRWELYKTVEYKIDLDFGVIYRQVFSFLDNIKPTLVFLVEDSLIDVIEGKRI